jgi:AcrR family transcriptional regulator
MPQPTRDRPLVPATPRATASKRDRGYESGRSTRELILRTAERLFAERGIHGVSLREIAQAAGQRNNGATQYHFGSRENLLAAIYVYRATPINTRRRELLAELAPEDLDDVEALLRVILLPHAESLREPENEFVGYLARVLTDEARLGIVDGAVVPPDLDVYREIEGRIRNVLPQLTDERFGARFAGVFSWAIHALAEHRRSSPRATARAVDVMFDDLVRMLASALCAPLP